MDFHDYATIYQHRPEALSNEPLAFYDAYRGICWDGLNYDQLPGEDRQPLVAEFNRAQSETDYYRLGTPYYKIYPSVYGLLSRVSAEIPGQYFNLPFAAFAITFPKVHLHEELACLNNYRVQSMLVSEFDDQTIRKSIKHVEPPPDVETITKDVYLWVDIGERHGGIPAVDYIHMPIRRDKTLNQSFEELPRSYSDLPEELARALMKVMVSVCFLATGGDKLIEPDVLSKDFANWLEAKRKGDQDRQQVIEERAVRRGKQGWSVGRELALPRARSDSRDAGVEGRELSYQHQRSAHLRIYHERGKVVLVRQHTVRPDLPVNPNEDRSYGIG